MREQFQEELNAVSATLVQMAGLVKTAMENATTALLTADLALAEKVIAVTGSTSEITYTSYSDAYPAGFEDIQRRVPDISKVKNAIGWAPTKDLKQIISDIAAQ